MEQKKVTYTGLDTEDVTQMLEEGNRKQAEKGWQETYVRGEPDEDEDLDLDGEGE